MELTWNWHVEQSYLKTVTLSMNLSRHSKGISHLSLFFGGEEAPDCRIGQYDLNPDYTALSSVMHAVGMAFAGWIDPLPALSVCTELTIRKRLNVYHLQYTTSSLYLPRCTYNIPGLVGRKQSDCPGYTDKWPLQFRNIGPCVLPSPPAGLTLP